MFHIHILEALQSNLELQSLQINFIRYSQYYQPNSHNASATEYDTALAASQRPSAIIAAASAAPAASHTGLGPRAHAATVATPQASTTSSNGAQGSGQ
jgi:hypothetical protein